MDVNGSRYHLLLGQDDWSRATSGGRTLGEAWNASPPGFNDSGFDWDYERHEITLEARAFQFVAPALDNPPALDDRRGAARDRYGNWYWIDASRERILVRSSGTSRTSVFWPATDPPGCTPPDAGEFAPVVAAAPPRARMFSGLTVTDDHYLAASVVDAAGLYIFDLHAGGPPREVLWPAAVRFEPFDMSPKRGGGAWILDRANRRLWMVDRHFLVVSLNASPGDDATPLFTPLEGPLAPPAPCARDIRLDDSLALEAADPVAVEVLPDCSVLVLDRNPAEAFSRVYRYAGNAAQGQPASLDAVLTEIETGARGSFRFAAHDFAFSLVEDRLYVVSSEGNQAFAFHMTLTGAQLRLRALGRYFPMRLFGGKALVAAAGRLYYDFSDRWIPLVEQRRPRYVVEARLETPLLDSREPGCVWHRLLIDACIPPGTAVRAWSAASEDARDLDTPAWGEPEPAFYLRPAGAELPFVEGQRTAESGAWELLLQAAKGRYAKVRLELTGDGRATPRIRALRVWYPRFSYLRYLPAIYREEPVSTSFLDRYLANVEGQFTGWEDRVAAVQVLFDPRSARAGDLEWLAAWFDFALDPVWDEDRRRMFLEHAMQVFQFRGTTRGLILALRLALDECVDESVFAGSARSGYRIVERFRVRRGGAVLAGDPTETGPREIDAAARWIPAHTAAELERRYREALKLPATAHFPVADPDPLTGQPNPAGWRDFATETLGFVPVRGAVEQRLWQDFLARRYHRIAALNELYGGTYAAFAQVPLPFRLPLTAVELRDWHQFQSVVLAMRLLAHRFTVMLPMPASLTAESAEQRRRLDIARRVVKLEKPAHTTFDVKFYWALFRVGDARLGEDTHIGLGSRAPELLPPALVGDTHLAETYLAPGPPQDSKSRTLAQCRVPAQTTSWQGEEQ